MFPDAEQVRKGLILPLDDMVAEYDIDLSSYVPAIVEGGIDEALGCGYEGQLYCLGSYAGSTQMLYNKDMFDAAGIPYPAAWPPMTPEEFVDIACQLTDAENGVWGGAASDPLAYVPFDMMFSAGREDHDRLRERARLRPPDGPARRRLRERMLPQRERPGPLGAGPGLLRRASKLAMVITDFQGLEQGRERGINWGSTAPPTPAGVEPYFFMWSDNVGRVRPTPSTPDEAKDFVAYVTTEGQRIRYETEGSMPLDLAIAEEVDWAGGIPGREDGLEVLSHARPMNLRPEPLGRGRAVLRRLGVRPRRREDRPGGAGRRGAGDAGEPRQGVGGLGGAGLVTRAVVMTGDEEALR